MVWYEIKKILLRPSCQIALLLLLLMSGRFCIQVMWGSESAVWVNDEGKQETGYAAMQNSVLRRRNGPVPWTKSCWKRCWQN